MSSEELFSHKCGKERFGCFHCCYSSLFVLLDDPPLGPEKPNGMNRL